MGQEPISNDGSGHVVSVVLTSAVPVVLTNAVSVLTSAVSILLTSAVSVVLTAAKAPSRAPYQGTNFSRAEKCIKKLGFSPCIKKLLDKKNHVHKTNPRHHEDRKRASVFFSLRVGPRDLVLADVNAQHVAEKETPAKAFLRVSAPPWWIFSGVPR
jgi:hypothetical protein